MEQTALKSKAPPINLGSLEIIAKPDHIPLITVAHAIRRYLLELHYHSVRDPQQNDSFEQCVITGALSFYDELSRSTENLEGPITAEFWLGYHDKPNHLTFFAPSYSYRGLVEEHMEKLGEYLKKSGLEVRLHSDDFPQPL